MKNKSEVESSNIKINNLQDYVSVGYLTLLFLGIFRETVYYGILGINILNYSSLIDVLLSPIALLTEHVIPIVIVIFAVALLTYIMNRKNKSLKKKTIADWIYLSLPLFILVFFGVTVGNTVSKGFRTSKKIAVKRYEMDHQIMFTDNEIRDVKVIGQNSEYIFYITENNNQISISPIKSNIKRIEKIAKSKKLKK